MSDETTVKINRWIIDQMNRKNWSMRELGRRSNIDQSKVSKVLADKTQGDWNFYFLVADAFGKVPEMLQVADMLEVADESEMTFSELLKTIKTLDYEEQKEVSDFVDFLLHKRVREAIGKPSPAKDDEQQQL